MDGAATSTPAPGTPTRCSRPAGPGRLELDPYPFGEPEFQAAIPVRELDDRAYVSPEEAAEAFHTADLRERRVTLAVPD